MSSHCVKISHNRLHWYKGLGVGHHRGCGVDLVSNTLQPSKLYQVLTHCLAQDGHFLVLAPSSLSKNKALGKMLTSAVVSNVLSLYILLWGRASCCLYCALYFVHSEDTCVLFCLYSHC